jgi:hypothetical protein
MIGSKPADKDDDDDSFKTDSNLGEDEEQPVVNINDISL